MIRKPTPDDVGKDATVTFKGKIAKVTDHTVQIRIGDPDSSYATSLWGNANTDIFDIDDSFKAGDKVRSNTLGRDYLILENGWVDLKRMKAHTPQGFSIKESVPPEKYTLLPLDN